MNKLYNSIIYKRALRVVFLIVFTIFMLLFGQPVQAAANQPAMWFMDDLNITQVPGGGYSHSGTLNFDVVGVNQVYH